MQIEIQIPKAVLFDVKYTVEQATNFAKKEGLLNNIFNSIYAHVRNNTISCRLCCCV